jgi:cell cycle checkpoint control protein RAD9A
LTKIFYNLLLSDKPVSQRHPSNWVDADEEEEEEDDDADEDELCVQSTPPYYEEQ